MRYADITFRPLGEWPGGRTLKRRASIFGRVSLDSTIRLLVHELTMIEATRVVLQIDIEERHIRVDGKPWANAVAHGPGVILSFESVHGPLRYSTDVFNHWHHNLRAIAVGLESLRRVDRYGIATRGEQYAGWRQITAGGPSPDRGRQLIAQHGGVMPALKATHPDHGGSADDFADVQAAREEGAE